MYFKKLNLLEMEIPRMELVDSNADYSGMQTVFINFSGANGVLYDKETLNIHITNLSVAPSGLSETEQFQIITDLNNSFAEIGISFVATQPDGNEHSTIYIGNNGLPFRGLAETIDVGNKNKNDEAFVFSNAISSTASITEVIIHETGHLLSFAHEGDLTSDEFSDFAISIPGLPEGLVAEVFNDNNANLDWTNPVSASKYQIQIDSIPASIFYNYTTYGTVFDNFSVNSEIDVLGLNDGRYSWRVRAYSGENYGEWVQGEAFTIDNFAAAPSCLGVSVSSDDATLNWTWNNFGDLSRFKKFVIYVDTADDFSSPMIYEKMPTEYNFLSPDYFNPFRFAITCCSQMHPDLTVSDLEDGTYFWKIYAEDNAGNISEWSQGDSFTIDTSMEGTKFTASDAAEKDGFARSISASGKNFIVGAEGNDDNGENSGSAYVYRWNGESYDEVKLIATDGAAADFFGDSVSMSGDNIVVGARADDDNGFNSGSVYSYRWNGTSYDEYKMIASDGSQRDMFGCSVSMSGDNFVVGAQGYNLNQGSVYSYRWNGEFYDVYKLTASDGLSGDMFGSAVSISGDNIVVGAKDGVNENGRERGSVYAYRWNGESYDEYKMSIESELSSSEFGGAVSIDGDNFVVGDSRSGENGHNSGSAYVYRWNGESYDEHKLIASDGAQNDHFGYSVTISGDYVLIGASGDNGGSASLYCWNGTLYDMVNKISAYGGGKMRFGSSVSIFDDTVAIGALYGEDGSKSGSTYVYSLDNLVSAITPGASTELSVNVDIPADWTSQSSSFFSLSVNINPYLEGVVKFDWENSSEIVTKYQIQIDDDLDFFSPEFNDELTHSMAAIRGAGLSDGRYFWRVRAFANNSHGEWVEGDSFIIDTSATAPDNINVNIDGDDVTFGWTINNFWDDPNSESFSLYLSSLLPNGSPGDLSGIKNYTFYIDDDADFSDPLVYDVIQRENTGCVIPLTLSNSLTVEDLAPGTYHWKMRVEDNVGNVSEWTDVDSFTIPSCLYQWYWIDYGNLQIVGGEDLQPCDGDNSGWIAG